MSATKSRRSTDRVPPPVVVNTEIVVPEGLRQGYLYVVDCEIDGIKGHYGTPYMVGYEKDVLDHVCKKHKIKHPKKLVLSNPRYETRCL